MHSRDGSCKWWQCYGDDGTKPEFALRALHDAFISTMSDLMPQVMRRAVIDGQPSSSHTVGSLVQDLS